MAFRFGRATGLLLDRGRTWRIASLGDGGPPETHLHPHREASVAWRSCGRCSRSVTLEHRSRWKSPLRGGAPGGPDRDPGAQTIATGEREGEVM
jgi:hypothetical protein